MKPKNAINMFLLQIKNKYFTDMNARPKITLELTHTDKIIEISSFLILAILWILVVYNYAGLPTTIPTHYNALGEADRFGNKDNIFSLPIIATVLFVGMTFLNKFPHIFNYPTNITTENALGQYTNATKMIRAIKFAIVFIFALITLKTMQSSTLGIWFLPLVLMLIFIPIFFQVKSSKLK